MQADVLTGPDAELRDGFEVHRAALRHGLSVTLLPRQVMTITRDGGPAEMSFVHGVPEASTLAGVTFAHDRRIRRDLLRDAGVPIPEGGVFSIGRRGEKAARSVVSRIGFPMVIKPAVGDNLAEVHSGIAGEDELAAAVDYFWTPDTERPDFVRAAYALTETRELGEIEGRTVAPPGFRLLAEQHVRGEYLRFLVIGGTIRAALHCPGGPWARDGRAPSDITEQVHPSISELVSAAAAAVPGLAVTAVDVVAARGHGVPAAGQDVRIVELSERPWLATWSSIDERLGAALAEHILTHQARLAELELDQVADDREIQLHLEGVTRAGDTVPEIEKAGRASGLAIDLTITDPVEGIVDGTVRGPVREIAWLTESLLGGALPGSTAIVADEQSRTGTGARPAPSM